MKRLPDGVRGELKNVADNLSLTDAEIKPIHNALLRGDSAMVRRWAEWPALYGRAWEEDMMVSYESLHILANWADGLEPEPGSQFDRLY